MKSVIKILLVTLSLQFATHIAIASEKIKIVTSFSILADIIQNIGGDRVSVESLVAAGEDAHAFNPTPTDVTKLARADLVVINGLGFEGWIERLITSTQKLPKIIVASDGIAPLNAEEDKHNHDHSHGHDHGELDPHAWQDVANVRTYAKNIATALASLDPNNKAVYDANLGQYDLKLLQLDTDIRTAVSEIPESRRKLVTTHDAFGYFEKAYGIEMIAALGVANEAQPSAKEIARIIRQIREEAVPAIFLESMIDPRLARRLSTESNVKIGGTLYSDALSEKNGPAGTYIAMMEANIRELKRALAP